MEKKEVLMVGGIIFFALLFMWIDGESHNRNNPDEVEEIFINDPAPMAVPREPRPFTLTLDFIDSNSELRCFRQIGRDEWNMTKLDVDVIDFGYREISNERDFILVQNRLSVGIPLEPEDYSCSAVFHRLNFKYRLIYHNSTIDEGNFHCNGIGDWHDSHYLNERALETSILSCLASEFEFLNFDRGQL